MKQLTTAFVAILFAGYEMADVPYTTLRNLTALYGGDSRTTTVEPILPAGNDSVYFKDGKDLVQRMKRLRENFSNYDAKVMVFVSDVNQVLTSFNLDKVDKLVELTNYLPIVEKKISRRKCHCEGTLHEPCPQRCINSCYIENYGHQLDCTKGGPANHYNYIYYCYEGSPQMKGWDISQCYDPPTVDPCFEFAVNQTNFNESYLYSAKLLVEPARIKVRGVQRNLKFARESIRSMDTLSDIIWQQCRDPQNTLCFSGMTELIETKVKYYEQLAKNITKELLDTQTEIDRIEGNMHVLTEGAIKQINDARKNYTCCLKGLHFQVEGVECGGTTTDLTEPVAVPKFSSRFICRNGKEVIHNFTCDGVDDCGDNSDEDQCVPD